MENKAHASFLKRINLVLATLAVALVLTTASDAQAAKWNNKHYYKQNYKQNEYRYDCTKRYDWSSAYREVGKPYKIGRPLPSYVRYYPVPRATLAHLRPAPHGMQYVQVNRDILLISLRSGTVFSAFTLLR